MKLDQKVVLITGAGGGIGQLQSLNSFIPSLST